MRRLFITFLPLFFLISMFAPNPAFGWGAGMHATLTAHAHDRMEARWKDAMDHGLLIYGSWGPDVWYILSDYFMSLLCPVACGSDDGRISNECWGRYTDPDRYFGYTRAMMVRADSLEAVSWVFGYGAHAVEDWRGHMEYIIPDWVNPSGSLYNRHTLIDSAGAALVFNSDGLYGYPTRFLADRHMWGYAGGGFLNEPFSFDTATRDPHIGAAVSIVDSPDLGRVVRWMGILDEEATGLAGETVATISDNASLASASEGVLAAIYGDNRYSGTGDRYPVVIEDGEVAINCGNNFRQRMEAEEGFGYPIACQISKGAVSGLKQWPSYLKPHDETSDHIEVDSETVAIWMENIAVEFSQGGTRLDDRAVFGIDPETGLSTKHLEGIDGRDFTFGRSMPEIVDEVLDLSIQDIVDRLFQSKHMLGTVMQSRLSPVEKARFTDFGFHYRPRMAAWPDRLPYEDSEVQLHPGAPGPYAQVELSIDLRPGEENKSPDLVYPYYIAEIRANPDALNGVGQFDITLAYRGSDREIIDSLATFSADPQTAILEGGEGSAAFFDDVESELTETRVLRVLIDNAGGGWYRYNPEDLGVGLVLRADLAITDPAQPPYDWQVDMTIQGYCEKPDLNTPGVPPTDNSACPLTVPDFPVEPEAEDDSTDGDAESEIDVPADGDDDDELPAPADDDRPISDDGGSSGCSGTNGNFGILLGVLLIAVISRRRRVLLNR